MARLKFRTASIILDEEEEVREITAIVVDDTLKVITDILGQVTTLRSARGGAEMTIVLPVAKLLELFHACGRMNGYDPRYSMGGHEIYDSLSIVVYRLIEDCHDREFDQPSG